MGDEPKRVRLAATMARRRIVFNACRAPGNAGVFVTSSPASPRSFPRFAVWHWPGWPANDQGTPGRRPDLDHYYALIARGQVTR